MIFIDRASVTAPSSLIATDGIGKKELARAREHFANGGRSVFKFSAYKSNDVIDALNTLFRGKCAYCESLIGNVGPTDIEHYRPKGEIEEDVGHPGYWWLAAEWTNLLPSCIDCNRRRHQEIYQLGPNAAGLRSRLSGKGTSFPIFGPAYAQGEQDSLEEEDPALINPTIHDPASFLEWTLIDVEVEGAATRVCLLSPCAGSANERNYGIATAHVVALNRSGLVDARTQVWNALEVDLINLRDQFENARFMPVGYRERTLGIATNTLAALWQKAHASQPYSSMVKEILDRAHVQMLEDFPDFAVQMTTAHDVSATET